MGNPTPIILLFFIAFIGLVYILSTCDWKASFEPEPTVGSNGNSKSNIPAVAKALATADQSTTESILHGQAMTLQCPTSTDTIKKITSAKYKCGKTHVKDITTATKINDNCKDQTVCTVQTEWDHTNVWLHITQSDGTHFKQTIQDPYPGCNKHLDISFSCESDQAQSKFITLDPGADNTISCLASNQVIKMESAWLKNRIYAEPKKDVLTDLKLNLCDGRETCNIKPITMPGLNGKKVRKTRYSFGIQGVIDCTVTRQYGMVKGTGDGCDGLADAGYEDEMELAVVYYCEDKQLITRRLNEPGRFQCVIGQKLQLERAQTRDISTNQYDDVLSQLDTLCNGQDGCNIDRIDEGHELFVDYYCVQK